MRARASRDEGAPLPVVDEPRDAGADEFYDFLARERWRRPVNSGRPEPFTRNSPGGETLATYGWVVCPFRLTFPFWNARRSSLHCQCHEGDSTGVWQLPTQEFFSDGCSRRLQWI